MLAAVLMSVEGGTLGLISYSIKPMFDRIFVHGEKSAMLPVAVGLFGLFALRGLSAFGQRVTTARIGLSVVADLQRDLVRHLLTLDSRFFHAHAPGTLLERVRGDAQTLQNVASQSLIVLGRDSISLISLIAVAIHVDWQWTLIAFVGAPLLVLPVAATQGIVRRTTRLARQAAADATARLDEILHGFRAVKLNNMEDHEQARFGVTVDRHRHLQLQSEQAKAALPAMIDLLAGVGFVGVLVYGGRQIIDGEKTLGEFMSFFTALALLFDPVRRLSGLGGALQAALASLERLYGLFDLQAEIRNVASAQPLARTDGDIHLSDVSFAYESEQPVLSGLTLTARAGQLTALVGASGAGKSTVFNLLTRLADPQSGRITIGDQDLREIDIADLRRHIAVVAQDTALFDESLRDNIAYGDRNASDQAIAQAADQALVSAFAASLPQGLSSPAGPRGANLSGGQRQRVAIARALLRDAPILLLDEATSALDSATEQRIQAALEQASRGRTTVVIAHRLSTVRRADVIHVIDAGKVAESGRHDELLHAGGIYSRLHKQLAS
ncbi:ABC transporter ATP-binding protein [Sinimarinibacterium sp. CAU 1509]|nr:ABC transporter ATP-binding protein [Sinimarinibacterium sp. CAU 1509]